MVKLFSVFWVRVQPLIEQNAPKQVQSGFLSEGENILYYEAKGSRPYVLLAKLCGACEHLQSWIGKEALTFPHLLIFHPFSSCFSPPCNAKFINNPSIDHTKNYMGIDHSENVQKSRLSLAGTILLPVFLLIQWMHGCHLQRGTEFEKDIFAIIICSFAPGSASKSAHTGD